jgi:hypothetical protein
MGIGALGLAGAALLGCGSEAKPPAAGGPSAGAGAVASATLSATAGATATGTAGPPLLKLKVQPETGAVGDALTVTAEGMPPGKSVDFQWDGRLGAYTTKVIPDNVEYTDRTYKPRKISLGTAIASAQGVATVSSKVPEDHGDLHDIFAAVAGENLAKGGFNIKRTVTLSSKEGAIGAPITVTVTGMSSSYYQSTMAVRWDNMYTGFISTVMTNGTAVFNIRAAGPVGDHTVQVYPASHGVPYLNSHQGPNVAIFGHLPDKFVYRVTRDGGAPAASTEWPESTSIKTLAAESARTAASDFKPGAGVSASVTPASGPILGKAAFKAAGLPANTAVELAWVTARGNRASNSGWSLQQLPLGKAATKADGALDAPFEVPDDLGGWHAVQVLADKKVVAEVPYYIERNLTNAGQKRVKAGEIVTIQMKGIGWTELDNGVAVTYDNGYVGDACGFNSNGDITLYLTATGGPGTHIVDIYPMIYEGRPNGQVFNFEVPQLTALRDNPSLAIGYRLPIFRTAFEIVE